MKTKKKTTYRNNNQRNDYTFKSGVIPAGGTGSVYADEVSKKLIDQKILTPLTAEEAAKEAAKEVDATSKEEVKKAVEKSKKEKSKENPSPVTEETSEEDENKAGGGKTDDEPWSIEDAAQWLIDNPDSLDADADFTASGKPEVKAISAVFEQEFKAVDRDAIWEIVTKSTEAGK